MPYKVEFLQDLEAVDPDYFKSLGWVLENDVEAFMIDETFTTEVDYFGRKETIALKPGGKDIKLTEANKREYVDLKAQLSMTTAISEQLKAFLGGFWDIIPKVHILPPYFHCPLVLCEGIHQSCKANARINPMALIYALSQDKTMSV